MSEEDHYKQQLILVKEVDQWGPSHYQIADHEIGLTE